jgi:hypothetical protein
MQNIDKEFFTNLRERLPSKYAAILFRRYQQKKVKISRVLIYKVANGERNNAKILNDLIRMAEDHEAFLKRVRKFEKRLGISKIGRRQNGN